MPDSFFTSNKPRKRKRTEPSSVPSSSKSKRTRHTPNAGSKSTKSKRLDEDLNSDQTSDAGDDDDFRVPSDVEGEVEGEDDPDETPAEKRLRLAQLYLDGVKEDLAATQGGFDAAEIDKELISSRLRGAQYKGKVHLFVAEEFAEASCSQLRVKGHKLSCTAAVASPVASSSGYHLFTAGKEGHIFKWDLQNGKKIGAMYKVKLEKGKGKGKGKANPAPTTGHTSSVTSLALTTDGSYLASGAMDSRAGLWDARNCRWITGFAHKDTVSSLSFRTNTNSASASSSAHTLYTASFDRTVKLWTLPPAAPLASLSSSDLKQPHAPPQNMGYIETLFGHQDQILALDCLPSLPTLPPVSSAFFTTRPISSSPMGNPATASAPAKAFGYSRYPLTTPAETLLTVGARDKTARFWKVPEETQLVFRGGGATSSAASVQETSTKRDKLRDVLEGKMDALASDDEEFNDTGKGKGRKKNENEPHRYIEGSIESVAMIDENTFLTGGDSGSICLWSTSKKKPIFTCGIAHGVYDPLEKEVAGGNDDGMEEDIKIPPHPRWITALESLRYSNLFASGSYDGVIRLWKLASSSKRNTENQLSAFTLLSTIPCAGVINSLQFITPEEGFWPGSEWAFSDRRLLNSQKPRQTLESDATGKRNADARPILLIASIGQEHRFGRWVSVKQQIIEVPSSLPDQDGEVLMDGVEVSGEADSSRTNDVQMKRVAVRNGAIVFALFPRGWVK